MHAGFLTAVDDYTLQLDLSAAHTYGIDLQDLQVTLSRAVKWHVAQYRNHLPCEYDARPPVSSHSNRCCQLDLRCKDFAKI